MVARSEEDAGVWDQGSNISLSRPPMRRDTVLLQPNGNLVLRFRSDNPGVWMFHCHIEWHLAQGLIMTLVEVSFIQFGCLIYLLTAIGSSYAV